MRMSNLQECSIDELNEIIRVVVLTCPWSNETKFLNMKKIAVIKSCGFANSDGDALEKKEKVVVETEEELWKLKLSEMKENGLRLVTGEEYKVSLGMKNRPTMIPLWVPIGETVALDATPSAPLSSNVVCDTTDSDRASNSRIDDDEADMIISLPSASSSQISSSQDNMTDSVATASPNPKRIRCGTRPDCMNEDTDTSNAITVEWARPNTMSH